MAVKLIRKLGDPVLRSKAKPITEITPRIHKLLDDLWDTMYAEPNGAGLAAPQIGILRRAAVIDLKDGFGKLELINPEIIHREGQQQVVDGCLSIPDMYYKTIRPEKVVVKALNRQGEPLEIEGSGTLAHCLAHEIDHLDGILFIDYLDNPSLRQLEQRLSKDYI